jgi:hypothetical protein
MVGIKIADLNTEHFISEDVSVLSLDNGNYILFPATCLSILLISQHPAMFYIK